MKNKLFPNGRIHASKEEDLDYSNGYLALSVSPFDKDFDKEVEKGTGGDKNDQIALEYVHWGPAKSKPAIRLGNFRESEVRCSDSRADCGGSN